MLTTGFVLLASAVYLGALFAIASWGDRDERRQRALIRSSWVYTLSLSVYCTAWTFYGNVGLALASGLAFLPVYLGPTLAALLFPFVLRKILRIAKAYGITSIADFISARYGKSGLLAGLVTIVAVVGVVPYAALQLKALAASVTVVMAAEGVRLPLQMDLALLVALLLAAFCILFGTRHIDATEHHQGMVLAIAFESVVKLVSFLVVGLFVTYGLFDGFGDILGRTVAAGHGALLTFEGSNLTGLDWFLLTAVSGIAALMLPRQFQVAVIENVDERHLTRATWLFPLYLVAITLFVLPIALAGRVQGVAIGDGDLLMLTLPAAAGQGWVAMIAYLGGLSAATAMLIVESVALSTMLSNDLVVPILLRWRRLGLAERKDLSRLVLGIRRAGILVVLLLGWLFYRGVGETYALVSIGLISFAAVAQFAPPILLGAYWRDANRIGALLGLAAGFLVWLYTLILPAMANAGLLAPGFVAEGPLGIALLKPQALFGLDGLHPVAHALIWSLAANIGALVLGALLASQDGLERLQAILFVEVDQREGATRLWRGETRVAALKGLLVRFLGEERAVAVFALDAERRGRVLAPLDAADADLVQLTERQLARAIGAASARVMVGSVVTGEVIGPNDVMEIIDEASQILQYSQRLEQKSRELEAATAELRRANERLRQLDQLKDDFIATVSHELRTPLTSIRSFSEILLDTPDLSPDEQREFLLIVVKESERLTRLINDILDMSKIESGKMEWHVSEFTFNDVVEEAAAATSGLFRERRVRIERRLAPGLPPLAADRDRIIQVVINLLSNAAKFAPAETGRVLIETLRDGGGVALRVQDNGPGIPPEHLETVFEKFHQVGNTLTDKPKGTGLGLTICRHIIEHFGGRIWAEPAPDGGSVFWFTLPAAARAAAAAE